MKVAVFDTHAYDRAALETRTPGSATSSPSSSRGSPRRRRRSPRGFAAVCSFVNDRLDADDARASSRPAGVRLVALRSAGYNHVDLRAAARLGLAVVRVPEYSPHAVAEHAVALVLALDRKIHRAWARVREGNFSLDGLVGFDLHGKTVGLVGTGRIGAVAARICTASAAACSRHDSGAERGARDRARRPLRRRSTSSTREADIISLHVPLTPATHHLIDAGGARAHEARRDADQHQPRRADRQPRADHGAQDAGSVGAAGLDVYEEEEGVFFQDLSDQRAAGRRARAAAHVPERARHVAPGLPHARGARRASPRRRSRT